MNSQCNSTTYTVIKMAGPARETLRLFALWVRERGNLPIKEVQQ